MTRRAARFAGMATLTGAVVLGIALWKTGGATQAQNAPEPARMRVPVVVPAQRDVPLEARFTGLVEAIHRVDLRPRVAGQLDEVLFREGALVARGAPLFQIDRRPYAIALRRAEAELAAVDAQLTRAREELARAERLRAGEAVSQEERDRRRAEVAALEARRLGADAAIADARLQLEFTTVRAPVAGRMGRAEITRGNLVTAGAGGGAGTRLAELTSVDPIYVYFDVDPATAHRARSAGQALWQASITTLDGSGAERIGAIDFVNNTVGADTGTLQLRARLTNSDGQFLPASIVNVAFRYGVARQALVIPDAAIATDQGTRFVLAVGADDTLEYRPVELGDAVEGGRVVIGKTLAPGDRIVLQGAPGLRPGLKVTPFTPDNASTSTSTGATAAAPAPESKEAGVDR